eukprot:CAMPEP_0113485264 /NCGR_PEP_ID=MMETSP0014_2-20120614/24392_1 /TAXON_ID=2857 /ORGANISM="Nitzschia sp." /LENGTH=540 /DNA_ID=CAMNT_0000378901 /DNA_START=483 /DNA_END=2102 /DNA_ORIENTATION=+ /assembly_acc=CAM_ASM_000159
MTPAAAEAAAGAAPAAVASTTSSSTFERPVTRGDDHYTPGSHSSSSFLMIDEEEDDEDEDDYRKDDHHRQQQFRFHRSQKRKGQKIWRRSDCRRSCMFRKIITVVVVVSLLAATATTTTAAAACSSSIFALLSTAFVATIINNTSVDRIISHPSSYYDGDNRKTESSSSSPAIISIAHAFSLHPNIQQGRYQYSCRRRCYHYHHHQQNHHHHRHHERIVQSRFIFPQQHRPRGGSRSITWWSIYPSPPSPSSWWSMYMSMSVHPNDHEEEENNGNSKDRSSDEVAGPQPRRSLTDKQKQAWQQKLEEIQQYQDENNGSSYPPKGDPLRKWADHQRGEFKKDLMYTYRIELLNSIDFQWSKPRGGPRLDWDMMFDRLVEYKERCDDIIVPTNYPEDPQLGTWCWRQDGRYMEGKLDPEQKAKLDSIGFVFGKVISQEDRWNGMYDRLVEYRKKNNSTLVPQYYEEDPELGSWVKNQRNCFNTNDSRTTPQKIERLEAIGFVWNPHEAAWLEMYNRLQEYKHKNGNADVKKRYKKDPKLGLW